MTPGWYEELYEEWESNQSLEEHHGYWLMVERLERSPEVMAAFRMHSLDERLRSIVRVRRVKVEE